MIRVINVLFNITAIVVSTIFVILFLGLFSEELNIMIGRIPRGGIYKIESVEGDIIEVRRLRPNNNLQETDSWEFEEKTKKIFLSEFYGTYRLVDPPEYAIPGGFLIVWRHHNQDINMLGFVANTDRRAAFEDWRLTYHW